MPDVNYYLKPGVGKPKRSLVYMQVRHHGQKFFYSMRFNIEVTNWDPKKQMVKARSQTMADGSVNCNELLKNMKEVFLNAYHKELATGIPANEAIKKHLDEYMFRNILKRGTTAEGHTLYKLIDKFISGEIGEQKTKATITTYRTSKKHLQEFETLAKYPVNFDTISLEFKYAYVNFLTKDRYANVSNGKGKGFKKVLIKGLGANSVAKEIKNVRTFMNMANELGYTKNIAHKSLKFGVKGEDSEAVYLSEKEIRNLYKFDFSDNKRLEQVRDQFVLSSFVGLRYSDASRIRAENIVKIDGDDYIKITSQKTGKPVTIPLNDIVLKIIKKYNPIPPPISNQKFNDYLKEVAEKAGLTETGRLSSDLKKPLFECISSHTARRNFATNCYLAGMDSRMIMAVTGHTTEKSFEKYIKVTREETAKRMGEHMKKADLSKAHMKAVG